MEFKKTKLEGVIEIIPNLFEDDRGYFMESYNKKLFSENGIDVDFVQDNQSMSSKGTLRGLHFQKPPYEQDKLVSVVRGRVTDVVVDMRWHSPTYKQFETFELDSENKNMVFIPKGFAHGFISHEDNTIFTYKCSNFYNKDSEGGIHYDSDFHSDKIGGGVKINWGYENPIVSDKDKEYEKI
jgi:dTDP-4-dehydrorhamnose 3,5-epimerase